MELLKFRKPLLDFQMRQSKYLNSQSDSDRWLLKFNQRSLNSIYIQLPDTVPRLVEIDTAYSFGGILNSINQIQFPDWRTLKMQSIYIASIQTILNLRSKIPESNAVYSIWGIS